MIVPIVHGLYMPYCITLYYIKSYRTFFHSNTCIRRRIPFSYFKSLTTPKYTSLPHLHHHNSFLNLRLPTNEMCSFINTPLYNHKKRGSLPTKYSMTFDPHTPWNQPELTHICRRILQYNKCALFIQVVKFYQVKLKGNVLQNKFDSDLSRKHLVIWTTKSSQPFDF